MFTVDEHEEIMNKETTSRSADASRRQILIDALAALEEFAGIIVKRVQWETNGKNDTTYDARIIFKNEVPPHCVEIKSELTPARLGPVLAQLRTIPSPVLLVARYINPRLALRLKEAGIHFIDTAGNVSIQSSIPFMRIWIEGKKIPIGGIKTRTMKAFRSSGLRVIFPLLCLPNAINETYRFIAKYSGTALGTVAQTMNDLKKLGFISETKSKRVIKSRDKLLNAWVDGYARELRPTLNPRRYQISAENKWKNIDLSEYEMWLGGETAAALLTKYIRPEIVTLYGTERFPILAGRIHATKAEHGNLEVLEKFWFFEMKHDRQNRRIVPPLLVYADLIASADGRNLETAALIREMYLA